MIDLLDLRRILDATIASHKAKEPIRLRNRDALLILQAAEAHFDAEVARATKAQPNLADELPVYDGLVDRARQAQASGTILLLRSVEIDALLAFNAYAAALERSHPFFQPTPAEATAPAVVQAPCDVEA